MKKLSEDPLVSIVITCHNYGRFLKEAIDSCIHQTYKNNEIIVIDDGSTDDTAKVSKKYNNKINYYYQKNKGVVSARNEGSKKSKGKYIIFLDADDILDKNYIEVCLKTIRSSKAKYVYTDMILFGAENKIHKAMKFDPEYLVVKGNFIHVGALVDARAFEKVGGFSEQEAFEDWDLWLKFLENGYYGEYTPDTLYHYRRHQGSRDDMPEAKKKKIIRKIQLDHSGLMRKYYRKDSILNRLKKIYHAKKR